MPSSIELLTAEMHMEQSTSRAAEAYERAVRTRSRSPMTKLALMWLARLHERDADAWRAKYLCEIRLQEFRIIERVGQDDQG